MLEKPGIPDEMILSCIRSEWNLDPSALVFLPLGADVNTAVYRLTARDGADYFLKLRKSGFEEVTVALPWFLTQQDIRAVIAPLQTISGSLWAALGDYHLVLYPFVPGLDGYQADLMDTQWLEYGAALKALHSVTLPPELAHQIPVETFDGRWRAAVRDYQRRVEVERFDDSAAARMAAFIRAHRAEITHAVDRAEALAAGLRVSAPGFVLCHADIHPGNLHLGADGRLYIVDWDNPRFALKELDLMFAGATHSSPCQDTPQEALFYQGYGPAEIHRPALAYYRYQRVIEDIAAFAAQLLDSSTGNEDREQSLAYFTSSFLPGRELDIARRTDPEA